MAKQEQTDDDAPAAAPAKGGSKAMLFIMLGAVALVGLSVAGSFFITKALIKDVAAEADADVEAKPAKEKPVESKDKKGPTSAKAPDKPAVYLSLEPAFLVNHQTQNGSRFLQLTVEIMTRDPVVVEEVKKHMPSIRNNLVLMLSSLPDNDVMSREGKEKIRADALAEINKILTANTGKAGVESVYITNFVMQ